MAVPSRDRSGSMVHIPEYKWFQEWFRKETVLHLKAKSTGCATSGILVGLTGLEEDSDVTANPADRGQCGVELGRNSLRVTRVAKGRWFY